MAEAEKKQSPSMHASSEGVSGTVPCRLRSCRKLFHPQRKNQFFCRPAHRVEHHSLARDIGTAVLDILEEKEESK